MKQKLLFGTPLLACIAVLLIGGIFGFGQIAQAIDLDPGGGGSSQNDYGLGRDASNYEANPEILTSGNYYEGIIDPEGEETITDYIDWTKTWVDLDPEDTTVCVSVAAKHDYGSSDGYFKITVKYPVIGGYQYFTSGWNYLQYWYFFVDTHGLIDGWWGVKIWGDDTYPADGWEKYGTYAPVAFSN